MDSYTCTVLQLYGVCLLFPIHTSIFMVTVIWTDKVCAAGKKRSFLHKISEDVRNLRKYKLIQGWTRGRNLAFLWKLKLRELNSEQQTATFRNARNSINKLLESIEGHMSLIKNGFLGTRSIDQITKGKGSLGCYLSWIVVLLKTTLLRLPAISSLFEHSLLCSKK